MAFENQVRNNQGIWKDTSKLVDHYKSTPGLRMNIYKIPDIPDEYGQEAKVIKVFPNPLLDVVQSVCDAGFRPLVVNMANENYPMEGVISGVDGAEADLIRRSNMYMVIKKDSYPELYPLKNGDFLYFPTITIFKDSNFRKIQKPMTVALISIPTVRRPSIITVQAAGKPEETYSNEKEAESMKRRIEAIFKIAIQYQHHTVIINDFGITEANPIKYIVRFFNEAMKNYPVKYVFFAIGNPKKTKDPTYLYMHNHIKRPIIETKSED